METQKTTIIKPHLFFMLLVLLLILMVIIAAASGAFAISFTQLIKLSFDDPIWNIWFTIRLPRILLAIIVGMALASSGAVMQGLFRNPLADPSLLGISSGSALAVAFTVILPLSSLPVIIMLYSQMLAAFIGGTIICIFIYIYSYSSQGSLSSLILLGVAINAIIGAIIGLLSYMSNDIQLRQISLWSMGYLGKGGWEMVCLSAILILPAMLGLFKLSSKLNILQLGDENAYYLGLNVQQIKRSLLLLCSLLIGTSVAINGIIAFVGLVIPHVIRLLIGADHRHLVVGSALGGAILLLLADTLARTLAAPAEIPVGLITSLIGGPYFLFLLMQKRRKLC